MWRTAARLCGAGGTAGGRKSDMHSGKRSYVPGAAHVSQGFGTT